MSRLSQSFLRLLPIALLALPLALGASVPTARADDEPPHTVFLPITSNGQAAPDLIFSPATVSLAPGASATVQVRVEPQADLRGATFELPGVQDGVTSRFAAAADGTTGTLTIEASAASEASERPLTVQGKSGVDSGKTWTGALRVTISATLTAKTLFVDAKNGNNNADGSQSRPLKTIKKALSKAQSGDTVKLLPGQYTNTGSGDRYPLTIPNGVTIAGTRAANGAQQSFLSPVASADQTIGLTFAGDATVKDLEMDVFGTALFADKGKLSFSNLNLGGNRTSLRLSGTAQTTLTNTNMDINPLAGVTAVNVDGQAKFTMDGGKIETGGQNCVTGVTGIFATDSAQVVLRIVRFEHIAGFSLNLLGSTTAKVENLTITREIPSGCQPGSSIHFNGAALTVFAAQLVTFGGIRVIGLDTNGTGSLKLDGVTFAGDTRDTNSTAILLGSSANKLTMSRSDIHNFFRGIDAAVNTVGVTITNSEFSGNKQAILTSSGLRLRNSSFIANTRSVEFSSTNVSADLGTAADPGGNTFLNASTFEPGKSIAVNLGPAASGLVSAVGNTWTAATQQSDINGHYSSKLEVGPTSKQFENKKKNFFLPNVNTKIQF